VKVIVFTSRDTGLASATIAGATSETDTSLRDTPSHCGLILTDGIKTYCFEAAKETAWRGPFCSGELHRWLYANRRRWIRCFDVPATPEQASAVMQQSVRHVGVWLYGRMQLWWAIRYGIPVPVTPAAVTCSEGVARILALANVCDMRSFGRQPDRFDCLTPLDIQQACSTFKDVPLP
jgi:hypothetical protein